MSDLRFDPKHQCTATSKQSGERCRRSAAPGCDVCTSHGGKAPQVREAGQKRLAEEAARNAVAKLALPRHVEPHDALIEELERTAGWVTFLEATVPGDQLTQYTGKDGEKVGALVDLLNWNRQHLARVAKECISAGIEERRVRITEDLGRQLGEFLATVLPQLGVDLYAPETRRVVEPAMRKLRAVA